MIRAREIRVVYNTEQLGIMDPREALRMAEEKGLDLVEIAPLARPPVCRIMDYGRFLYEEKKKAAEARKKQKHVVVKEIKMTLRINVHDLDTKRNHAVRFLESGAGQATIMLRGRGSRQDQGAIMLRIAGSWGLATVRARIRGPQQFEFDPGA